MSFLATFKKRIVLVAVLMLLSVAMALPLPFLTMMVIDHIIKTENISRLPLICGGLLVVVLVSAMIKIVHALISTLLQEHVLAAFQIQLFKRLQTCAMSFYYSHSSGYLASRLRSDIRSLSSILIGAMLSGVQCILFLLGAVGSLFYLSWKLALICLAILPFFSIAIVTFNRRLRAQSREAQETAAKVGSRIQESLAATPVIRALGAEQRETRKLQRNIVDQIESLLKHSFTASLASRLTTIMGTLGPLFLLWFGAREYFLGTLTLGQFVAFNTFLGYVFAPVQALFTMNINVQMSLSALRRLMEINDLKPEPGPRAACRFPSGFELRVESLTFGYEPDKPVLKGFDLLIPQGETLALVGPSGEGKTSLLRLLLRFHDPDQGRILLGGVDIRDLPVSQYRSQLAVVFQEPYLLRGTIEENLLLARPNATAKELCRACDLACAHDFINNLPDKYQTLLGENAINLSAGQKIRLAIARALLREAPILLLDEPTAAIDEATARAVLDNLGAFLKKRSCLLISHQMLPISLARRVCTLKCGCTSAEVSVKDFFAISRLAAPVITRGHAEVTI
jgi:ABC-type multidrug transport system fused ATPase/permease subunit